MVADRKKTQMNLSAQGIVNPLHAFKALPVLSFTYHVTVM